MRVILYPKTILHRKTTIAPAAVQPINRPRRVVVYTDSAGIGGAEISLGHLVATVSERFELTVVGVSPTVVHTIAQNRPHTPSIVLSDRGMGAFFQHRHTFQQLRPDLIHVNLCTPWAGAIGLAAALSLPNIRVVRVDQLPLRTTEAIALWRTRALCLRTDAHVAVGEASCRRMEDFYALGRHDLISIPNGVPDYFQSSLQAIHGPSIPSPQAPTSIASTSIAPTPITVGSVGRLDAMKGHDGLLRAIAPLQGVNLVILGDGEQRNALKQLATELGLGDRLQLPGWVNHPSAWLPHFAIFAMPSRSEGFPLAMVEAMLAGCAIVATRVGSMPEAILPGQTGLLVEKDDIAGLTAALRQLQNDAALRSHLGQAARAMALQRFTVDVMAQAYESLWEQVLASPAKPRAFIPRPRD